MSGDPDLWNDQAAAQRTLRRAEELRDEIGAWRGLGARARAEHLMLMRRRGRVP